MLRNLTALVWLVSNHTIKPTPLIAEIIPTHIVRQTILRAKKYTLGTCTHNEIVHRYKSVNISLLVNHIFHETMNLTINERIELEAVWMLTMSVRSLTLSQNITERRKVIEMPVIIHEPLSFNQRNIIFRHTSSQSSLSSVRILGIYNISLILNINLEIIAIVVVVTSVSRFTLLAPNLNHSAERRVGRIHEVDGLRVELTKSLSAVSNHEIPVSRQPVYLLQLTSLSRRLGKLSKHIPDCNVMHLAQTTHVPTTEIPHIIIYEEIVRVHVVRPAIQPTSSPSILFLIDSSTAYQELFHGSCIQFGLSVQLSATLQHHAHGLAISFLVLISGVAGWFLAL